MTTMITWKRQSIWRSATIGSTNDITSVRLVAILWAKWRAAVVVIGRCASLIILLVISSPLSLCYAVVKGITGNDSPSRDEED